MNESINTSTSEWVPDDLQVRSRLPVLTITH